MSASLTPRAPARAPTTPGGAGPSIPELLNGVPDFASEAIIVYEADGRVVYWNAAAARLYGWPAETTLSQRLDPLAEREWLPWDSLGDFWSGKVARRRLDGALVTVDVRVLSRRDAAGRIAAFIEYGGLAAPAVHPAPDPAQFGPGSGDQSERSDRFRRLLEYMPIALWQVDARSPGQPRSLATVSRSAEIRNGLCRNAS